MTEIFNVDKFPYSLDKQGETYILVNDIAVPGTAFVVNANDITLDLNGHTITFGTAGEMYRYGVAVPPGYQHANPIWSSSDIPSFANGRFPTIKNGSIVQGGTGAWCFGIGIYGGLGLTVTGVTIHMKGADSWPIRSDEGTGPYIINKNRIDDSECRIVTNRHQGRAAIDIESMNSGTFQINENVISQSPQWGIRCAARNRELVSGIAMGNTITHYTTVTNGYGIGIHCNNMEAVGNEIHTGRGRGIHIEGDFAVVHENVIDVMEEPVSDEYPSVFSHGIKLEGCSNAEIYDNAVTAYAINNIVDAAGGATALNIAPRTDSFNHIYNNEFRAVNLFGSLYDADNYGLYATPIEILESPENAVVEIHNNLFLSNDKYISFREVHPVLPPAIHMRDNTFQQLVEDGVVQSARPPLNFMMSSFRLELEDCKEVGIDLLGGVAGWPWNRCEVAFTKRCSIVFRDQAAANLPGATIRLVNEFETIELGTTDEVGRLVASVPTGYVIADTTVRTVKVVESNFVVSYQAEVVQTSVDTSGPTALAIVHLEVPATIINVPTSGTNMPDDIMPGDIVTLECAGRLENQPFQGTVNIYKLSVKRKE